MVRIFCWLILCFGVICGGAVAGDYRVTGVTDKADAMYRPGEKMVFSIQVVMDGKPVAGRKLRWERTGDDQKTEKGELVSGLEPVRIITSLKQPGFVYVKATAVDEKGKDVATFDGGAGVQPEKLRGVPEPKDFDAFWREQKRELSKVPVKWVLTPIPVKNSGLAGFDVQVDCAGGRPVSGYLVRPKTAAPRSLPGIVSFHGYGVSGAYVEEIYAARGLLALDINAHGIANGREPAFYDRLGKGELSAYGFKDNEDRKKSYFRGMLLRVMRSLEFIKAQPEWDGKHLIVVGGSQGGFQALAAAGLDPQVSFCMACKPWLCDLGGCTLGRLQGWRPGYTPALGYFDPANLAKRIKGWTVVECGLGDYVCPPSGVSVMVNSINAPKTIIYIQGSNHGYTPPGSASSYPIFAKYLEDICKPGPK